jgi:flagellar hook assembly protein FlgD
MNIAALDNAVRSQSATKAHAAQGGTTSGNSSAGSVDITANDFLTILVAELQNQDPTSDQDPNEYVDQLVQINSLEQLISINTGVGSLDAGLGALSTAINTFTSSIGSSSTGSSDSSSNISRTPMTDLSNHVSSSNHASNDKAAAIGHALVPNNQS